MKKIGLSFMLFIVLFTLNQCSNQNPSSVGQTKSVQLSVAVPAGFDTIAQYAVARVSGKDMDSITQPLTIKSTFITGTIRNIPAGSQRLFEVEVYGFKGTMLYYGSACADIYPGRVSYLNITLHKPGGSAAITGTIEDYPPSDTEYVTIPGKPFVKDIVKDSNQHKYVIFSSDTAFNSLGHIVEYGWRIVNPSIVDTVRIDSIIWVKTPTFASWVSSIGPVRVQVKARCKQHPWIESGWSQSIISNLNDTNYHPIIIDDSMPDYHPDTLIDTPVVIDTMPDYHPDTLIDTPVVIDTMPDYHPDTLIDTPVVIDTMPQYHIVDTFTVNFKAKERMKVTNINLYSRDQVSITASGSWNMDTLHLNNCGPGGDTTRLNDSLALFPFFPSGALLGEFYNVSDTAFYIGSGKSVVSPGKTDLLLFANCRTQSLQGNEWGVIKVTVIVTRR
jgi:hypothetical protein